MNNWSIFLINIYKSWTGVQKKGLVSVNIESVAKFEQAFNSDNFKNKFTQ